MSLSRVGGSSAAATSIAIPAHVAGDLIVIWAYRDGSTTPPTAPAAAGTVPAFTTIDGPTGANLCSAICAYAVAAGTTDTSGTWANATGMSVEVWRGAASPPIGGHAQSGASVASGANIAIPAITLTDPTGNSAILAFAGWQTVTAWNAAPSGYTQQSQVATECEALSKNTTTSDAAFNVTGTASATGGTRTQQLEIVADLAHRVSQVDAEVLLSNPATKARVSQEDVEVLLSNPAAKARTSQVSIEVLNIVPSVKDRVSQVFVEVLRARADVRNMDFIASVTVVHAPTLVGAVAVPFISSHTTVYALTVTAVSADVNVPFIGSVTVVHAPALVGGVTLPFIHSRTVVWGVTSLYDPDAEYVGPGNGGEAFLIELAPNGSSITATLTGSVTDTGTTLLVTGDSGMPTTKAFVVTVDDEVMYVSHVEPGRIRVRLRGMSNTTAASHSAGASVTWNDHYDMALVADAEIDAQFTADIESSGSFLYPGWLICIDSTQAYLAGDRYPMHVTEVMGVFDAGAGASGSNRCDATQPNAICTPVGASDDCPAALSNPSRIASDINPGDVAVVRYTNPEASVLDLGPRSAALQSWFGLQRVDAANTDVTFTDPNGMVVDTTGGEGTYTGSVNGEFLNPLGPGIAKDASDAAGHAVPTPNDVAFTTVTLPGTDRYFTIAADKGWPMCCLTVRQGKRRVPYWESWDWRDYGYVYSGFATDATFAQLLINRNGIVFNSVPVVEFPRAGDVDGPDAVWDDGSYYFGASWYVVLFNSPYLIFGPNLGGHPPTITGGPVPNIKVHFSGGTPSFSGSDSVNEVEGGSGGGIIGGQPIGLHVWQTS